MLILAGLPDLSVEERMSSVKVFEERNRNQELMKSRFPSTIQEQLGFKLEPSTAVVEVLFVDHVEKPSEN
jgi:uncharacterized protein (TIGR03435 family)